MPEQTRVKRPRRWEDVAGIGPTRAKTLRQEVGRFDGTFTDIRDTRDQREILSRSTSGTANQLPDYAENAVQAARDPSPDVVDGSLVETREVDPRTAQTRSRTTIRREAQQDDRRGQGFETMQRDPEELDRAAERFRDEFDDPFDVPAADIGRTAREELPDDRATSQPLINTAGSRTLFRARDAGDGFRQELERQTENIDRATASPGELADAFVSFVDDTVGLSDPQPRGVFSRGVRKPTDIGRTETGRFDRPDTDPAVDPQPIARDKSTGRFALDPFDIGASLGGLGSTDEQFGDSPTTVSVERSFSSAEEERGGDLFETAHAEGIGGSGTEDSALGLADAAPDTLGAGFERTDVIREEGARQIETARFRRNDPAAPFDEVIDVQEINGDFTIMDGIAEGGEVDTGPQFRTGGSIESQDDAFSMASQLAEPRDSGGEWR